MTWARAPLRFGRRGDVEVLGTDEPAENRAQLNQATGEDVVERSRVVCAAEQPQSPHTEAIVSKNNETATMLSDVIDASVHGGGE